MNQRIIKQFQDAIKAHKAGRVVNFEELPTPPGTYLSALIRIVDIVIRSYGSPQFDLHSH